MKNRSAFEWILIVLLSILLVGAIACFGYLVTQYHSLASPLPVLSAATDSLLPETVSTFTGTEDLSALQPTPSQIMIKAVTRSPKASSTPTPTQYILKPLNTPGISPYSHFLFGRPLDISQPIWPLAELRFGSATNRSNESGIHTGLDLLADYGTPVYALGPGEVIWSGYGIESYLGPDNAYGVAVTIKHDAVINHQSVYSIYAHLSVTHVEAGDRVARGDLIGEIGLTGNTSGPHLHLEVRLGDDSSFITRNPELYISPLPGHGVLAARLLNSDGSILHNQEMVIESLEDHQIWSATSYATGAATSDYILMENLVVGDLPAGQYAIVVNYGGAKLHHSVMIYPGEITFFTLQGYAGYSDGLPPGALDPLQAAP
ncbi:MAG: M23 family metallopeptidase [Anaerolineaceae bacterium]